MLVFREGAGRFRGTVAGTWRTLADGCARGDALETLLRAAELETAFADASDPREIPCAALVDYAARALVSGSRPSSSELPTIPITGAITIIQPEGYSFYAVHPLDFVAGCSHWAGERCAVIGIRSIGTSLAAVVAAKLDADRITVRPFGHPYDRQIRFSTREHQWIQRRSRQNAVFIVVDEGPGLSGSSFLSVAEALVNEGVAGERITLFGTRVPTVEHLKASSAATRWPRFRYVAASAARPPQQTQPFPGADWRNLFWHDPTLWPAAWTAMSAPKFLSADSSHLYKYEGLAHYGTAARNRSEVLAAAGFSPSVGAAEGGYHGYTWVPGMPLSPEAKSEAVISRLAEYIAFRSQVFPAETNSAALEAMARHNHFKLHGREIDRDFRLEVVRPVVADAQLMPHEWIRGSQSEIWKCDAARHGDNHFFPGPTDVAWDLAGAVVEWRLDAAEQCFLLGRYQRATADDAQPRLAAYITAYCAFRAGYAEMAAAAMPGTAEAARLLRDRQRYVARTRDRAHPVAV